MSKLLRRRRVRCILIGKRSRAYFALQVAGALIYNLAGWALQHRYGLALDQGLSPWPEHADNRDSHNHEMRGVTAIAESLPLQGPVNDRDGSRPGWRRQG